MKPLTAGLETAAADVYSNRNVGQNDGAAQPGGVRHGDELDT